MPTPQMGRTTAAPRELQGGRQAVQLQGATEHRSERTRKCVSEERREQRGRSAGSRPPPEQWYGS